MKNTKYGKRRGGRWTPIRVKAQDTRSNPNSWETHTVRKRWDIGLLRALSLRIMLLLLLMMMMTMMMMMMMMMMMVVVVVVGAAAATTTTTTTMMMMMI